MLVDVRDYTELHVIGATRDGAAGECFDKTARVLGLPYPGGKHVDALAKQGDDKMYKLPRIKVEGNPYDMSFSEPQDFGREPRPHRRTEGRKNRPREPVRQLLTAR